MAKNKNQHVIIAYFRGADKADQAANQLTAWDKANDAIKLGGVGILTYEDGKVHTRKVGSRSSGKGAKWGTIIGITAGVLSGGLTLIGGALVGAAGGAVVGGLHHKNLGLSDEDKDRLEKHLREGGASVIAMADEDEVAPTQQELVSMGGTVEAYKVPEETMEKMEAADDSVLAEDSEVDAAEESEDETAAKG